MSRRLLVLVFVGASVGLLPGPQSLRASVESEPQPPEQTQPGLSARPDLFKEAAQADREGIPEVCITMLRSFLSQNSEPGLAKKAKILLAHCLIETRQDEEALQLLSQPGFDNA